MKKLLCLSVVALTVPAFAWHYGPRHHWHGGCHHHHHGWHADDFWAGAGVGLVGGLVGAAVYNAVKPDPPRVVVQQPVAVQQPAPVVVQQQPVTVRQPVPVVVRQQPLPAGTTVWIEGRYIDQVQPDGSVARVWNPGHYEQR